MEEVDILVDGKACLTRVWVSEHAARQIKELCTDYEAFAKKIVNFAQAGFWNLVGEESSPVRHEVGETYRVWHKRGSLFRLIGFFEDDRKRDFIALDAFIKPGKDYTAQQWKRMREISDIKTKGLWQRKPSVKGSGPQ